MTRIKNMVDQINEEVCSAKDYAEEFITYKAKGNSQWATRYKEMAQDELKHAMYLHEKVTLEIEELQKVYTPPADMMEKWDNDHKKYIEKVAWVKQMLTL